jgi:hypothetical protein
MYRKTPRAMGAALLLFLTCAAVHDTAGAAPEPELTPPPGATIVREVQAGGAQVYACRAAADGAHLLAVVKRAGAVPALMLKVVSSNGSGALSGVQFVRRADTEGGAAPATGCDAAHAGATTAVHYSAVYTFFR